MGRAPELAGKVAVVTGSSSGIGRAVAEHLARQGMTVFATVRKDAQAEALARLGIPGLVPLSPLDLTRPEQIAAAAERIRSELAARGMAGLYAVVNSAGGGEIAPVELMDVNVFRGELETRLVGPVDLLQRLLPELRRGAGRIVWITTPALLPIPYVGSIHVADFAVNCLARTLDLELRPWGIPSIQVRCGGIQTPSPERTERALAAALGGGWPRERAALYKSALRGVQRGFEAFDSKRTPAARVGEAVERALRAARPRRRYQVGHMSRAAALGELLPQWAQDAILARR